MKIIGVLAAVVMLGGCPRDHRHFADAPAQIPPVSTGSPSPPALRGPEPVRVVAPGEESHTISDSFPESGTPESGTLDGVNGKLQDVFFQYDRADLTEQAASALQQDAGLLASIVHDFPAVMVTIEGHCDERGSAEYNLALGDDRAARAAEALRKLGVSVKLETVSYGKENPQCSDQTESCWQKNRRAHLVVRPSVGSARVN